MTLGGFISVSSRNHEEIRRETFKIARKEEWPSQRSSRQIIAGFLASSYFATRRSGKMFCSTEKTETTDSSTIIKRIKRTRE